MNRTLLKHIITLEDPIEYRFRDQQAVIHQREVGVHVDTFATGLRSALREAPDVILVGEMRDQDTIAAALTAAETGHLVLSTLHSGHSAQAIDRIIDVFPDFQQQQVRIQLADVLRAVVTQRLLPTIDGTSRVPAVELVNVTYAVANTIREGRTHQLTNLIQSGLKQGMIPSTRAWLNWSNQVRSLEKSQSVVLGTRVFFPACQNRLCPKARDNSLPRSSG